MKTMYERYGIECHVGWHSLYEPLIRRIEEVGGVVRQVKEKFGALRVYYSLPDETTEEIKQELFQMKSDAEGLSVHMCEVCGKPGTLVKNGWWKTRCKQHLEIHP